MEVSLNQDYLEGSNLFIKYCNQKMLNDLAIVSIKLSSMEIISIARSITSTIRDRMGLIGKEVPKSFMQPY